MRGKRRRSSGGAARRQPARAGQGSANTGGAMRHAGSTRAVRLARPGAGQPARELDADAAAEAGAERPAPMLEIVGASGLQRALADFAREQDGQANRAWRRPGGLARMAWL